MKKLNYETVNISVHWEDDDCIGDRDFDQEEEAVAFAKRLLTQGYTVKVQRTQNIILEFENSTTSASDGMNRPD